jgi:hypothetical protein
VNSQPQRHQHQYGDQLYLFQPREIVHNRLLLLFDSIYHELGQASGEIRPEKWDVRPITIGQVVVLGKSVSG